MNTITHKGYNARIEFNSEDDCFVGHIAGIKDVIGFHSDSVQGLKIAFKEAVDDYILANERIGRKPQKPYSRKILLRIAPELHAKIALEAELNNESLNRWAEKKLAETLAH